MKAPLLSPPFQGIRDRAVAARARGGFPRLITWKLRGFAAFNRYYLKRHFHTVRVLKPIPSSNVPCAVVVYLNHAAWWDPLVCLLLQREFFCGRPSFAPIEARQLERYRALQGLGFFGIRPGFAGARRFLETGNSILSESNAMMWVTPEGRFADVRERPAHFRSGLGHLARLGCDFHYLPMAIEYVFWEERKPEVLAAFGEAIPVRRDTAYLHPAGDWEIFLADRLEALQDRLAHAAIKRDGRRFHTIFRSRTAVHVGYDLKHCIRACFTPGRSQFHHGSK